MDNSLFKHIISFVFLTVFSTGLAAEPPFLCPPVARMQQEISFAHATLFGARWEFIEHISYQNEPWLIRFDARLDRPVTASDLNSVLRAGNDMFHRITIANNPKISLQKKLLSCLYSDTTEFIIEAKPDVV